MPLFANAYSFIGSVYTEEMLKATEKIWRNGQFIAWDDAKIHVLSHVVSYGSSLFEGVRCYALPTGPAVFRLAEHMQRLINSSKIYRMEVGYSREELERARARELPI